MEETNDIDLCPFCAGVCILQPRVVNDEYKYEVICTRCFAKSAQNVSIILAISQWNERPVEYMLQTRLDYYEEVTKNGDEPRATQERRIQNAEQCTRDATAEVQKLKAILASTRLELELTRNEVIAAKELHASRSLNVIGTQDDESARLVEAANENMLEDIKAYGSPRLTIESTDIRRDSPLMLETQCEPFPGESCKKDKREHDDEYERDNYDEPIETTWHEIAAMSEDKERVPKLPVRSTSPEWGTSQLPDELFTPDERAKIVNLSATPINDLGRYERPAEFSRLATEAIEEYRRQSNEQHPNLEAQYFEENVAREEDKDKEALPYGNESNVLELKEDCTCLYCIQQRNMLMK